MINILLRIARIAGAALVMARFIKAAISWLLIVLGLLIHSSQRLERWWYYWFITPVPPDPIRRRKIREDYKQNWRTTRGSGETREKISPDIDRKHK